MSAIMRDSTPPPSLRCSMRPLGHMRRDKEEPEIAKPHVLRKDLIDDMTDFHGFITPGGKLTSQRLEDECSTALPSQCSTIGSLESLPTTPAGWGTLLPPPESGPFQGWEPGAQKWCMGNFGLPSQGASFNQLQDDVPSVLESFSSFLDNQWKFPDSATSFLDDDFEFPDVPFERATTWPLPASDLSDALSAFAPSAVKPLSASDLSDAPSAFTPSAGKPLAASDLSDAPSACEPSAVKLDTPSTPREERTTNRSCPQAPGNVSEIPILLKALKKNSLDLVMEALQSDPDCACIPFWDQNAEPPLCAAIRLGCQADIVALLLTCGADVKARNTASQNPLDLLYVATWRSVDSSNEIEALLRREGAELSEKSVELSQDKAVMMNDMPRWDAFADVDTLFDFGLPPNLGSMGFFDIEPPPPVVAVA